MLRSQTGTTSWPGASAQAVTDPAEKPVAGAVVVWGDDPYLMPGSQEVRTDERGAYCFPPLPPMRLNITVIAQSWSPEMKKAALTWGESAGQFPSPARQDDPTAVRRRGRQTDPRGGRGDRGLARCEVAL